eukprot:TRINITY_DN6684_c0_g1_i4.p1 TRINITY_DN6684_c0_g1~~TRINITY_DN6684_c0_g1_i4.p1  ORF type:complete len:379 (+),score=76.94 TRINITY_DN6684_c0_g1_i4:92-1138(+)
MAAAAAARPGAHDLDVFVQLHDTWSPSEVRADPDFRVAGPFSHCCVAYFHFVVLPSRRGAAVLCKVAADRRIASHGGEFQPTDPPLTAASAVCASTQLGVALLGDGSVHTWRHRGAPAAVDGLPPVALLAVGGGACIAVTTNDEVYGWAAAGDLSLPQLLLRLPGPLSHPQRIAALCNRRIRRLACSYTLAAAETVRQELLVWHCFVDQPTQLGVGRVRFPLRDLVCSMSSMFAADAVGAVWAATRASGVESGFSGLIAAALPQRQRAARLAARFSGVVALTAKGELWDTNDEVSSEGVVWRSVSAAHPELPLGLVPYGGPEAMMVVLAPIPCGGRRQGQPVPSGRAE